MQEIICKIYEFILGLVHCVGDIAIFYFMFKASIHYVLPYAKQKRDTILMDSSENPFAEYVPCLVWFVVTLIIVIVLCCLFNSISTNFVKFLLGN